MRPRVKICGITRKGDARLAVALGADAVGFVFWARSPRAVTADRARAIAAALPPFVTRVGVFVNEAPPTIARIAAAVRLDAVQLHGDEGIDDYAALGVRLIKVVTLEDDAALEAGRRLPPAITPLVDAVDRERRGGTGRPADWPRAAALAAARPTVLAGGLTPENVARAVRDVRPWAVDVSSGVEIEPGVKSRERLQALFAAIRMRAEGQGA
jgi:phosphoribosylanthranilate isomerase